MRIVVTGATGFIGRQVTAALVSAGVDVVAISRKQQPNKEVEWICADLLDQRQAADAIRNARADRLIHLAWTVEHGKFWTDPANLAWASASLGIAKTANEAGVQHITMCGTCFEYDWPTDQACDEESTPTAAHTLYDIAKDGCRRLIGAHAAWPEGESRAPFAPLNSARRCTGRGQDSARRWRIPAGRKYGRTRRAGHAASRSRFRMRRRSVSAGNACLSSRGHKHPGAVRGIGINLGHCQRPGILPS